MKCLKWIKSLIIYSIDFTGKSTKVLNYTEDDIERLDKYVEKSVGVIV